MTDLRVEHALARWITNLNHQGIVATGSDLRITAWNPWMEIHSGRAAADTVGRSLFDLFPDLAARGLDIYYHAALAGEISLISYGLHRYVLPLRPTIRDLGLSYMPQSTRVGPLVDADQVIGTVTIIDDVSDRLANESELRRQIEAQQQAREAAEKALRAKDEFLSTLSHEIRQPLNAVLGWTRILRGRAEVDAGLMARALEIIDRNATVQARMIDDLLDMARIVAGKLRLDMQAIDLFPVIVAAVDVVSPAASGKQVTLRTDLSPDVPQVLGDAARLQQIVWNLLSNAVKFTPPGGTVDVRLTTRDGEASITVTDSGRGISGEFLPFVFERFRQGDASSARREGGLGLGLALVRDLVELHGGTVSAMSDGLDRGATFSVALPTVNVPDWRHQRLGAGAPVLAAPDLAGTRVVVVDDEADARELVAAALQHRGAEVVTAGSSAEALTFISDAPPERRPHVVVSDIGMPDEDGYAFIQQLRALDSARGGRVPAVALTGYANSDDRARVLAAGYQAHVPKPMDPAAIAAAVAAALRGDV